MSSTKIEWTDATWNPVIGCTRVGPGCDHCYAIGVVHRGMSPQHVGLTVKHDGGRVDWTGEVRPAGDRKLTEPLRWRKPRRIFVNSLSDLFHADLPDEEIAKVFAVMALTPQHTYQFLTKRPQRMATLLADPEFPHAVAGEVDRITVRQAITPQRTDHEALGFSWPLPNCWAGTSIENDTYAWRADHLRRTPAAVRFISAEPLLGPLPSLDLTGIDWLIVGGESGPGARPMHPDWVRDLRDRCHPTPSESCPNDTADDRGHCGHWYDCEPCHRCGDDTVDPDCDCDRCTAARPPAFFFKQWGEWAAVSRGMGIAPSNVGREVLVGKPDACGCQEVMRRVGKKAAGRLLDGRTWDEYPA